VANHLSASSDTNARRVNDNSGEMAGTLPAKSQATLFKLN
jgi:hypothetical protein